MLKSKTRRDKFQFIWLLKKIHFKPAKPFLYFGKRVHKSTHISTKGKMAGLRKGGIKPTLDIPGKTWYSDFWYRKGCEKEQYPGKFRTREGTVGASPCGKGEKAPLSRGAEMPCRSPPLPGQSAYQPDTNSGGTTDFFSSPWAETRLRAFFASWADPEKE